MVFLQVDAGYSRLPKRGRGCHGGRGFAAATKESRVRRSSDRVRRNSVRVRRSSDRMRRSTDSKGRVRFPSRHPFGVHGSESYR
jgi:hypothetical protein